MHPAAMRSLDRRLYRAALALCPASFRREHGDEMALDFDQACGEAAADGDGALWSLRLLMAVDLVRTFGVQWLRTGFPAVVVASVLVTLALVEGLATVARRATVDMPPGVEDEEVIGFLFLVVICVLLIATTIALTLWMTRFIRRGRR